MWTPTRQSQVVVVVPNHLSHHSTEETVESANVGQFFGPWADWVEDQCVPIRLGIEAEPYFHVTLVRIRI
eukprot:2718880-Pyramimonas_sp.AAC.1